MIDGLQPYPEYRDSELPWLGMIPSHWQVSRSKHLFTPRKELARENDEQLSATQAYGVIRQKEYERQIGRKVTQVTRHLEKRRHVETDDFVISMRSFQRGLERAWTSGCIRSSYVVLQPSMAVDIDFFSYLFKSHDYIHALRSTANFIRDGQDLNFNNFSLIDLPLIPIEEQKAIARFLGHVDRRVRRYIRAKRRLIALLNEQKQAVIHQAVTRGLDPDVPLKPSGIDWLGDVPENWDAMPLRRIGRFRKGSGGTKEDDVAQGVPCIRYGHLYMYFDHVIDTPKAYISRKRAAEYAKVHRGEVIFAASGEDMEEIGKSAAVAMDGEVCCGGDAIIFRPWLRIDAKFLGYACDCWHAARQKASLGRGTTVKHIYEDQLKKVVIAIPPREEQTAIVADVEKAIERGDNAIATAERESLLIREYRIRLVADVVTGKLDVRDAAMRLPEVVGDFEENGDAAVEDEPPLGDDELDAVLEEAEA